MLVYVLLSNRSKDFKIEISRHKLTGKWKSEKLSVFKQDSYRGNDFQVFLKVLTVTRVVNNLHQFY